MPLYCVNPSAICGDMCVSWPVCLCVHRCFPIFLTSLPLSPPSCHPFSFCLSLSLRCQALSDFCSDPNAFVLNSTQFNSGTSSGTDSLSEQHFLENRFVSHACRALDLPRTSTPKCAFASRIQYNDRQLFPLFFPPLLCIDLLCAAVLLATQTCWIIT